MNEIEPKRLVTVIFALLFFVFISIVVVYTCESNCKENILRYLESQEDNGVPSNLFTAEKLCINNCDRLYNETAIFWFKEGKWLCTCEDGTLIW